MITKAHSYLRPLPSQRGLERKVWQTGPVSVLSHRIAKVSKYWAIENFGFFWRLLCKMHRQVCSIGMDNRQKSQAQIEACESEGTDKSIIFQNLFKSYIIMKTRHSVSMLNSDVYHRILREWTDLHKFQCQREILMTTPFRTVRLLLIDIHSLMWILGSDWQKTI